MAAAHTKQAKPPHELVFWVEYPERVSRWKTLLRLILAVPQLIMLYLLSTLLGILSLIAWFAILFTTRYPQGIFNTSVGLMRWSVNVSAYLALLRDEYPPFSTDAGKYPLEFDLPNRERRSRFRLFIRFVAIVPHYVVLYFLQIAWVFVTIFAWFAILVRGRYPRGLFRFSVDVMRVYQRQQAYIYLLTEQFPPYRLNSAAPPGNEVLSGVIGAPLFALGIVMYTFIVFGGFGSFDSETVFVESPIMSPAFADEEPSGTSGGVRVTLLDYDDDALFLIDDPRPQHRIVSFEFRAEKDGFLPVLFIAAAFRLYDCPGDLYFTEGWSDGSGFEMFWTGGEQEGTVYFEIPEGRQPCSLLYQFPASVEFLFPRTR